MDRVRTFKWLQNLVLVYATLFHFLPLCGDVIVRLSKIMKKNFSPLPPFRSFAANLQEPLQITAIRLHHVPPQEKITRPHSPPICSIRDKSDYPMKKNMLRACNRKKTRNKEPAVARRSAWPPRQNKSTEADLYNSTSFWVGRSGPGRRLRTWRRGRRRGRGICRRGWSSGFRWPGRPGSCRRRVEAE